MFVLMPVEEIILEKDFQTIRAATFDFRWTSGFELLPIKIHGFNPHHRSGLVGGKVGEYNLDLIYCEGAWATWVLSDIEALSRVSITPRGNNIFSLVASADNNDSIRLRSHNRININRAPEIAMDPAG